MKRFFFCIFVCIACVAHHAIGQVQFGLKGGLNASNVKFEEIDTEFILKLHVGAQVRIDLGEKFYIQPEVLFSQKGYEMEIDLMDEDADFTINYLSIPILIGYKVNKFSFYIGPEMDFKVSAYAEGEKMIRSL